MTSRTVRPMRRDDIEAVNELMAAAERVDATGEHYNAEDVLEEFENPMTDPAEDWLLVEVEGQVVAHSRLLPRAPADGSLSVAIDGTVHPDHRRQGIGKELVPSIVQRAGDYVREQGEDLRAVVTANVQVDNHDLAWLIEREGLRAHRWAFVMLAELTELPWSAPPALPEGYTLDTWEHVEPEEMRETHNLAFPDHPGFTPWSPQMWAQWVTGSRSLRPALSLLVRAKDGTIAAYLQTSEFDAVEEATGIKEAFVAKVGTVPEHRRRGLAGVLLQHALGHYREAGFDRSALDVDSENPTGALGIYERAGFRTHLRWANYSSEG